MGRDLSLSTSCCHCSCCYRRHLTSHSSDANEATTYADWAASGDSSIGQVTAASDSSCNLQPQGSPSSTPPPPLPPPTPPSTPPPAISDSEPKKGTVPTCLWGRRATPRSYRCTTQGTGQTDSRSHERKRSLCLLIFKSGQTRQTSLRLYYTALLGRSHSSVRPTSPGR